MSKRPAFWIVFLLVSALAVAFAVANFPRAFTIVSLDVRMDRAAALREAGSLATLHRWAPAGACRQAASFGVDDTVQTFVELAGGGKDAFRRMLDRGLYAAYAWKVRRFREGQTDETMVRFTPAGRPYGFVEKLREDAPGASLPQAEARRIAEEQASRDWHVDLSAYAPAEASTETKPGGRTDHTFVYERRGERLGEGRYRLRLVVSGDRLTELTHFVKVPESFTRRYEEMRSANNAIATGSLVMVVLYLFLGCGFGLFVLLRQRWVLWRQPLVLGAVVALVQALGVVNAWPLAWMRYDTALPGSTFLTQRVLLAVGLLVVGVLYLTLSFMAAESLTRKAFPAHPQLWRLWSREAAGSRQLLGRTTGGYLYTGVELAYVVGFYLVVSRLFGWWTPSEALVDPNILASYLPWLAAVAPSLHAGVWEELLFRALPIAGAALIGDRLGHRRVWIGAALVLQAVVFGAGHASYASEPAYSRLVELILPAFVWGLIYLCFGILPTIITHYIFDLSLFSIPLFAASSPGARLDQVMVVICGLVPLAVVVVGRLRSRAWGTLGEGLLNRAWTPAPVAEPAAPAPAPVSVAERLPGARAAVLGALGLAGLVVLALVGRHADAPRLRIGRGEAQQRALVTLVARGFVPSARWRMLATVEAGNGVADQFVWRTAGAEVYRKLVGTYLPPPRWNVRVATFTGDVVERAEEWQIEVGGDGAVRRVHHQLPERRAGRSLDEASARDLARRVLRASFHVEPLALQEISAVSVAPAGRRDWTFTFADTAGHVLPQGQLRLAVEIAGDQVADARRYVFVPEEWRRTFRGQETLLGILGVLRVAALALVMVAGVVAAIILWSRRRFPARFAWLTFGGVAVAGLIQFENQWPALEARFSTARPYELQSGLAIVVGAIMQLVIAAGLALFAGFAHGRARVATPARSGAVWGQGLALGLAVAGVVRALWWFGRAAAPAWPSYGAADAAFPVLSEALAQISGVLTPAAVLLAVFATVRDATLGWARRRWGFGALLFLFGALGGNLGNGATLGLWLVQAAVSGLIFLGAYVFVLRYDLTPVPIAVGTMSVLAGLRTTMLNAYPGAVVGGLAALALAAATAWLWYRALRSEAAGVEAAQAAPAAPLPPAVG